MTSLSGELLPSFLGPLSGLMKLLRSKAADTVVELGEEESLGARGRRRLQLAVAARERPEFSWSGPAAAVAAQSPRAS